MAISRDHHSLFLFQQATKLIGFAGKRWAFLGNQRLRGAPRKSFDRREWAAWFGSIDLPMKDLPPNAGCSLHPVHHWLEWFGAEECLCIDSNGKDKCYQFDLNIPLPERYYGRYHVVLNAGTSEHVYPNLQQVMRTCHDLCMPGGLILHAVPAHGCKRHGHWLCSAEWFKRLADEQFYETVFLTEYFVPHKPLGKDADDYAVAIFRKLTDDPFSVRGWRCPPLNSGSRLTKEPGAA